MEPLSPRSIGSDRNTSLFDPTGLWKDQQAILIGGGASLRGFDFSRLKGKNTIGINDAFRLGRDIVKYCFFGDAHWWHKNKWLLEQSGIPVITNNPLFLNLNPRPVLVMQRLQEGVGTGTTLGWNWSSGAAAINLAYSMGAREIFLLGYDMTNLNGRSHWHDHNPDLIADYSFQRFREGFLLLARALLDHVGIYNVTDGTSKLEAFPRISFEEFWRRVDGHHQEDEAAEGRLVETHRDG